MNNPNHIHTRLVTAKLFIDEHFAEDISISAIAAQACLSKFHFLRLFTRCYGTTPHQYLTRLRIRKARELMQNGASVTKALTSTGFTSLSSFNKLFRRHTRIVPSTYLQRMDQRRREIAEQPLKHIPDCFIDYMGWKK
jgi:AraC-like DNA-binding protein